MSARLRRFDVFFPVLRSPPDPFRPFLSPSSTPFPIRIRSRIRIVIMSTIKIRNGGQDEYYYELFALMNGST